MRDIQVTSVVIGYDIKDPQGLHLKMFNCPTCKFPITQYKGKLLVLSPGDVPIPLPIVIRCDGCFTYYSFHAMY